MNFKLFYPLLRTVRSLELLEDIFDIFPQGEWYFSPFTKYCKSGNTEAQVTSFFVQWQNSIINGKKWFFERNSFI